MKKSGSIIREIQVEYWKLIRQDERRYLAY